jgi:hypothetical protein
VLTKAEKPLTLSQTNEKLQHFEISFDRKNQRKILIWQF